MDKIPLFPLGRFDAIGIASSTGGPGLVEKLIASLPADMPVPIFIAQHLPPEFTQTFAAQIDRSGALTTVHADDGMPVLAGTVYVGPGRKHLRARRMPGGRVEVEVTTGPAYLSFKPSADELFRSLAKVYGNKTLGIVFTGIGHDGTEGARAIVDAGGMVITQNQETCAVYGMPRSVVEAGFSAAILSPDDIRRAILQLSPQYRGMALLQ